MAKRDAWDVDGRSVPVSNLAAPYWPEDGLTKGDLLAYYREMAPIMVPYFRDRPVTLRLFPKGIAGPSFYRRARPARAPEWLRGADYQTETDRHHLRVLLIDDAAGLVWCANSGSIEFHLWSSRLPNLDKPDQVVFDLDPGDAATFADVLKAALLLREILDRSDLQACAKTSGGRGLHVVVPLAPGHAFDAVRDWVLEVTERLAAAEPKLIAVAHGATHEGTAVTIDHAQNSIGRNTAAPYTVRAQPEAPVSAPVTWEEIEDGQFRPADLTLRTVPERVRRFGDLFAPTLRAGHPLPSRDR